MAAAGDIEGVQEHHDLGHLVQYSIRVPNFAGQVPFEIERSFEFRCGVLPTSWMFRVAFRRRPEKDTLTIQRNDTGAKLIDVDFWMKLFYDPMRDIPAATFRVRGFPHSRGLTRELRNGMPAEVMAALGERHVRVQISFGVRGCHQEKDMKKKVFWWWPSGGDEPRQPIALSSKM